MKPGARPISTTAKYLTLAAVSLLMVGPLWLVLLNSLKYDPEIYRSVFTFPKKIAFDNYVSAWKKGGFSVYYRNSIIISAASVVLLVASSCASAFALSRGDLIGKRFIRLLLLVGITIPVQVSLIPLFLQMKSFGLYNRLAGIVILYTAFRLSFSTFIVHGFMRGIPVELEEAALIDGASTLDLFLRIIIPLSRSVIGVITIFNTVYTWNGFWFPLVFLSSRTKKTLPVGLLVFVGEESIAFGKLFAGIMIMSIPMIVCYVLLQKQFVKGATAGAVKG